MKFIYLSDLHLRAKRPLGRIDEDYFEAQFNKLGQIKEIAVKEDIKVIIIGGDIFDSNKGSLYLLYRTMEFFRDWAKEGITIYSLAGNHDMLGQNIDALNKTFLGIMFASGHILKLEEEEFKEATINGIDYRLIPDPNYSLKTLSKKYSDLKRIIVSHDMITPNANFPFEVLPISKIKTSADLVLCSHYHIPFVKKNKDTLFINPGSMMRIKHTTENVERQPQIAIINVTKNKIDYKLIKLKAKKGTAVFDVAAKKEIIEAELRLEEFFSGLTSMNNTDEKFDIESALHILKKEKKIEKEIYEEALNRIQQAKEGVE